MRAYSRFCHLSQPLKEHIGTKRKVAHSRGLGPFEAGTGQSRVWGYQDFSF